ncbi:MAG: hypothetical protein NXH88_14575, partial [Hyphomonas sp.]|nr:hypothetical protein [Hyphomonas sp.]
QRLQFANRLSDELGIPQVQDPNDMTNEALAEQLKVLEIQGGFGQDADPYTLAPGAVRYGADNQVVASNPKAADPVEMWESIATPPGQEGVWQQSSTTGQLRRVGGGGTSVSVSVGADGTPYQSIGDVPVGQPVPEKLLGGISLPEDMYARRVEGGPGFEFAPIPGSAAESKVQSREDSSTIDTLINDYSTLARNNAITSRQNSALENAGAVYSGSFLGRGQDRLGGDVGNIDNYEARSNIEGLSMNALMKMISMSDVSARAMDSDAEMRAWLTAIKSDNYESALVKLHVLDQSFGSGRALQEAFENGIVDQPTYEWVTRRADSDPYTQKMAAKAQRYASLGGSIDPSNMTPSETESAGDLLEFMTPEERALFEGG